MLWYKSSARARKLVGVLASGGGADAILHLGNLVFTALATSTLVPPIPNLNAFVSQYHDFLACRYAYSDRQEVSSGIGYFVLSGTVNGTANDDW